MLAIVEKRVDVFFRLHGAFSAWICRAPVPVPELPGISLPINQLTILREFPNGKGA